MVVMKGSRRLIIMRHAKAGELPGGPDIERALTSGGRGDAAAAGEWLRAGGYQPDAVICSSARRARQTWQYASEVMGAAVTATPDKRLYQADAQEVIDILGQTPAPVRALMFVGHNPAAAEVVATLTGVESTFPASAMAVIAVPGGWDELSPGNGELLDSWTPADAASAG